MSKNVIGKSNILFHIKIFCLVLTNTLKKILRPSRDKIHLLFALKITILWLKNCLEHKSLMHRFYMRIVNFGKELQKRFSMCHLPER